MIAQRCDPIRRSLGLGTFLVRTLSGPFSCRSVTPAEYRTKWSLPRDYPMVAPNYAATRSQLAKKIGLGKSPAKAAAAPAKVPARRGRPRKAA